MAHRLEDWLKQWPPQPGEKMETIIVALEARIRSLEARVLLLEPNNEILNKHPALAHAYREYKIIERLTIGNEE
jgi:hypothetical protein